MAAQQSTNGAEAGGAPRRGDLTVQCALEGACVLLERDTLLSEALSLLDEAEQSVALIVSSHSFCLQ